MTLFKSELAVAQAIRDLFPESTVTEDCYYTFSVFIKPLPNGAFLASGMTLVPYHKDPEPNPDSTRKTGTGGELRVFTGGQHEPGSDPP